MAQHVPLFLVLRAIQQLCEDEKDYFPQRAQTAKTHFYIDDFLGGCRFSRKRKDSHHKIKNWYWCMNPIAYTRGQGLQVGCPLWRSI